ncbi:hypothetical protein EKO04_002018 [Ascochyta lentis]|uniref:Uncharacterized protein n=1 Tax=Ascochyta lentis TaxID=205686 RepID=A0A8H7MKE5_9PLEO|nr:hypothetical protein EKO04_002018 [Ascochyta lentis]
MNPLAASFISASARFDSEQFKPPQEISEDDSGTAANPTRSPANAIQDIGVNPARVESISMLGQFTTSHDPIHEEEPNNLRSHKKPRTHQRTDTEELAALRQANLALTQRLREFEQETPVERESRKVKLKNAEIEQLKATVERVNAQTEATMKRLAERQAYLRDLNAQIAKSGPPLAFAMKDKRKGKLRKGQKSGSTDED